MNTSELKFDEIVGLNNKDLKVRNIVIQFVYGRSVEYVDDNVALGETPEPRITSARILSIIRKPARRYGDLSLDIVAKSDEKPNNIKTYITQFDMTETVYNRVEPDIKVYEIK